MELRIKSSSLKTADISKPEYIKNLTYNWQEKEYISWMDIYYLIGIEFAKSMRKE